MVPLGRVLLKLREHLQGQLEIGRRHGSEHMRFDGGVDRPSRYTPTDTPMSVVQAPTLAFVDGASASRALIAHRHPPATAPAEHQALQERGALTGTTGHPRQIRAIAGQLLGISHVLLPTDR